MGRQRNPDSTTYPVQIDAEIYDRFRRAVAPWPVKGSAGRLLKFFLSLPQDVQILALTDCSPRTLALVMRAKADELDPPKKKARGARGG